MVLAVWLVACSMGYKPARQNSAPWWKQTVFYQIYMPSFQDSNGDGISDFTGMTSRLDYLHQLGMRGIWLTPFLESPMVDNGYDVADYYNINPVYGTMVDFTHFLDQAHRRGIKVIMDMVVNHTSTHHHWFRQSRQSRHNPYRNYYIWRDEPNNWESFFGGPAWTYDSLTGQYYYHKFDEQMADLNWQNPEVVSEIQQVLRYWLELGVDGFRLDVINFLLTDGILADNPVENGRQIHRYDIDQPGVKDAIRLIKATINEYDARFVVGEIGSDDLDILKQYQSADMMDVVFNFNFGSIAEFSLEKIFDELVQMEEELSGFPTLFFGSHDMPRFMNRLADNEPDRAETLAALLLTARGVPFIYYGEEIGMQNIVARSIDDIIDVQGRTQYQLALQAGKTPEEALEASHPHNRDRSRSPMQWDDSQHAGFTKGTPWIRVHENYKTVNVESMQADQNSIYHTYRKLIEIRNREQALQTGPYVNLKMNQERISFSRVHHQDTITVILNFGKEYDATLPHDAILLMGSPQTGTNSFLIYKH